MHNKLINKNFIKTLILLIILNHCQFQEPKHNHGILFLENRSKKAIVNKSNTNDIIDIFGHPHFKSIENKNEWFYIERVLSKGEYHQLGRNVLKSNNVLVLTFDKYGILNFKEFLNKSDKNKLEFTEKSTENNISQKSFVQKFLQSVKSKMYGRR